MGIGRSLSIRIKRTLSTRGSTSPSSVPSPAEDVYDGGSGEYGGGGQGGFAAKSTIHIYHPTLESGTKEQDNADRYAAYSKSRCSIKRRTSCGQLSQGGNHPYTRQCRTLEMLADFDETSEEEEESLSQSNVPSLCSPRSSSAGSIGGGDSDDSVPNTPIISNTGSGLSLREQSSYFTFLEKDVQGQDKDKSEPRRFSFMSIAPSLLSCYDNEHLVHFKQDDGQGLPLGLMEYTAEQYILACT